MRRAAFEQVGGYTEGIWAAEDTDFTWRLQDAGWTLEFNDRAVVQHAYRTSLRDLRHAVARLRRRRRAGCPRAIPTSSPTPASTAASGCS